MPYSEFIPGKTYIPVSGKVYDGNEVRNAIEAAKDGWWTEGRWTIRFENEFKKYVGVKYVSLTNSGSSANLLAVAALTSHSFGDKRLKPGDEFITTPVAFPTTVNPGIQYGLTPVFVDVKLDTLNIDEYQIEKAITKKTKLIMVAHTLGKPFDVHKIREVCRKYHIWLVEDCCDALGSEYDNKLVGTFGDIATFSFYPAHQLCMGEAGAIITANPLIHRTIRQFRDWGRDCWCSTGQDNVCGKRFGWKLGNLPKGYDHKYIFSQIGYNLKTTDFQTAIGCAQLRKLPDFMKKRKKNFLKLYDFLSGYGHFFQLVELSAKENPCWFGFPLILKRHIPFTRNDIINYLESNKIGTRHIFSGNLLKHPAYLKIKHRKIGNLSNADTVMDNAFWLGVYPGIDKRRMDYILEKLKRFVEPFNNKT